MYEVYVKILPVIAQKNGSNRGIETDLERTTLEKRFCCSKLFFCIVGYWNYVV